jgi:hypothetical protein
MTPQGNFMVAAAVRPGAEAALRELLSTLTTAPGIVDPANPVLPFAAFQGLHVARIVILQDDTLADFAAYDIGFADPPLWLALLGDCDGSGEAMLAELAARSAAGLRLIFGHCVGFDATGDLLAWMLAHARTPAACYVNWVGRTVRQVREEADLHAALRMWLAQQGAALAEVPAADIHRRLIAHQRVNGPPLTPPEPTPTGWLIRHLLNLVAVPLSLLFLSPLLLVAAPFFLLILRAHETRDPVIAPRPLASHIASLAAIEDYQVSNQFSAFGHVKPGRFRAWTLVGVFWLLDFAVRHLYTRGRLARVGTIHFARWVFLDGRRRLFFASNYDGSLDSYMDDFINKVAYGLNLVFSNGIGYPRTAWLVNGGAKLEQEFKYFLRRHQIPTQVWYKAYPALTAADLAANTMIREGLQRVSMRESEARAWLALI